MQFTNNTLTATKQELLSLLDLYRGNNKANVDFTAAMRAMLANTYTLTDKQCQLLIRARLTYINNDKRCNTLNDLTQGQQITQLDVI